MPKRVLRRRQRKALFEIERVFWEEGLSELLYDAACEVFLNREGQVVLTAVCDDIDPYRHALMND
jgi:hypothetical protein